MPEETFLDVIRGIMNSGSVFGLFLQVLPVTLLVGLIYSLYELIRNKEENVIRKIIKALFVCYLTGLINLVIVPANFWLGVFDGILYGWWNEVGPFFSPGYFNLIPSLFKWLSGTITLGTWVKQMLIGNFLMFIPLGVFLPFVTERINRRNIVKVAVFIPLIIEVFQLTVGRSFDMDDLMCNFIGVIAGFWFVSWVKDRKITNTD